MGLGILTGLLASLLGWQINILALHQGIERNSRTSTFFVGFGAAFADIVFILAAMAGAHWLPQRHSFWLPMKWIGIVTIFLLAGKVLFQKPKLGTEEVKKDRGLIRNFLVGFLLVICNPALFLLWIGVVSFLLTHLPKVEILLFRWVFLTGFLVGAAAWFVLLSCAILHGAKKWSDEKLYLISKLSAVALVIVGFFLIFEKF